MDRTAAAALPGPGPWADWAGTWETPPPHPALPRGTHRYQNFRPFRSRTNRFRDTVVFSLRNPLFAIFLDSNFLRLRSRGGQGEIGDASALTHDSLLGLGPGPEAVVPPYKGKAT